MLVDLVAGARAERHGAERSSQGDDQATARDASAAHGLPSTFLMVSASTTENDDLRRLGSRPGVGVDDVAEVAGAVDDVGEFAVVDHGPARQVLRLHAVGPPHLLQLGEGRAGEIPPVRQGSQLLLLIEGLQVVGGDESGVAVDGHQLDVLGGRAEEPLGLAELLGDDRAVGGAHVVEQGDGDGFAFQAGQGDGLAELVDEPKARCRGIFRLGRAVDRLGEDGVGVGIGRRQGHGGGAHQGDPDGAERGDRPECVGGLGQGAFPPRTSRRRSDWQSGPRSGSGRVSG